MSYQVIFEGYPIDTTVTANGAAVDAWLRDITGRRYYGRRMIVGMDIEWRPNYRRDMNNKAAILQLCVDTKCLIIQLIHLDFFPHSLVEFLRDPDFTFVGVEIARDVAKLNADYGFSVSNVIDVREMSLRRWPSMFDHNPGLKDLALQVVGLSMPKPQRVTVSNWEARWLDWDQIQYACIDAFASYKIGNRLINGL